MADIVIAGATENNLNNVSLILPRNKLLCFVGVSGSGKSTIAFDIIAREGQRQYFQSLPSYARRYLNKWPEAKVRSISGISATIVLDQSRVHGSPRSTVGTLTEAYTYLRLLYSRVGLPSMDSVYYSFNDPHGFCKKCKGLGRSVEVVIDKVLDRAKTLNGGAILSSEWAIGGRQWSIVKASGHFDMNKKVADFSPAELDKLLNALPETISKKEGELVDRFTFQGVVHRIMHRNTKVHRGPSESDMKYFDFVDCPDCRGGRLNEKALSVRLSGKTIGEVANSTIDEIIMFVKGITHLHAQPIKPRLLSILQSLVEMGVGYLTLNRSSDTLSGGEAQRVKMARQLGVDLTETIYVLDEPTAGLHQRDIKKVATYLQQLRDKGNTVLVVEHDETIMRSADYVVELGPGGGSRGGNIVAQGTLEELMANSASVTGAYLRKRDAAEEMLQNSRDKEDSAPVNGYLAIQNATRNNLKNLSVRIPLHKLVALIGVSGSGKSSLVEEIVAQHGEKVVVVDQKQIGANKRGCVATYIGVFDEIRQCFAQATGRSASIFSYNSRGGCPACHGLGFNLVEMNFLNDIKVPCEDCKGARYTEEVLKLGYKGKSIAEVLQLTAVDIAELFMGNEYIQQRTALLEEVGLGYIEMGQTLDTLSGGESQRLKLVSKLRTQGEFYILDEPTSGLHFVDIEKLLNLLRRLVANGNTVLVVEHNQTVIRQADWIVELGPEGGEKGGYLLRG